MKEGIKDYLAFNKRERNGIIVLLGLILVVIFINSNLDWFITRTQTDFSDFEAEIARYEADLDREKREKATADSLARAKKWKRKSPKKVEYFAFDPNVLDQSGFEKLGLPDWLAGNIINYREKGGVFRQKSDLKKIYSLREETYNLLEPWINLPDSLPPRTYPKREWPKKKWEKKPPAIIAINGADSLQWREIKGIGVKLSRRIVNYREKLGGFVSVDQVGEVWGLREEVFERIKSQLVLEDTQVRQLNINQLPPDSLWKHPYINFNLARVIEAYREQHGPYQTVMEVRNTDLVGPDLYSKIAPYLKVE